MTEYQQLGNNHGNYSDLIDILREKRKVRLGNLQPGEYIILKYSFQGANLQPDSFIEIGMPSHSKDDKDFEEVNTNPGSESFKETPSNSTDDLASEDKPKVFISYSHDSPEHKKRVLELSNRLRDNYGFNCIIDLYVEDNPTDKWPHWMSTQVNQAKFVIVVCTNRYKERANSGKGGVGWEGAIIEQELYDGQNPGKFICVIFDKNGYNYIPSFLRGHNIRILDKNYENYDYEYKKLFHQLSEQPEYGMPALGKTPRVLPIII